MSQAATLAGASAEAQRTLAEAMFAYIDQLAAESVEGYTEAQLAEASDVERRRATLFVTLTASPPPDPPTLAVAADQAGWTLPRTIACLVISGDHAARAGRRLSGDCLSNQVDEATYLVVPDPTALEREADAAAQRLHLRIGLGPRVALREAHVSLRWARLAHELGSGIGTVIAEQRLADIALRGAGDVVAALRARSLAPLAGEGERSRVRLETTLRAWLGHRGSQRAITSELACTRRPSATGCAACASCSGRRWRIPSDGSSWRSRCASSDRSARSPVERSKAKLRLLSRVPRGAR